MDEMSSNQHSSAYSSLANSTTEIHDIAKMEGEGGGSGGCRAGKGNRRTAVDLQMRAITEDYNALLRRATEQIRCAMLRGLLASRHSTVHAISDYLKVQNVQIVITSTFQHAFFVFFLL